MTINTRRPSGAVSYPITVLDGPAGGGKTYTAIEASKSDLVDRTFYIPFSERIPNDYDEFDFEIVEHDGTVRGVLGTIDALNAETAGSPTLLIFDSGTPYWSVLAEEVQDRASARPRRGGQDTHDLWVDAAREWGSLMERFRAHNGPVIITARADPDRDGRVEAHKSLLYDADLVIDIPERGAYVIRKVDSPAYGHRGRIAADDLVLHDVWVDMGVTRDAAPREYQRGRAVSAAVGEDVSGRNWDQELEDAKGDVRLLQALGADARRSNAATDIRDAIRNALAAAQKPPTKTATAA